ncbi:MAG: hypothetical protein IKK91_11480 [Ruminococcus sp.]|nr:hypothetical protein [Ruminococcus sp.]
MKKNFLMRISALAAASAMLMASVSCGKKDSSSDEHNHKNMVGDIDDNANVSPEDMPATVVLLTPTVSGIPIKMEYVEENINEQEAIAVARYLYGISEKNPEMVKSVMYDGMEKFIVSNGQAPSVEGFTDNTYRYFRDFIGEDYNFNYFVAGGLYAGMSYDYYDDIVMATDPSAQITGRKTVVMEIYYNSESKSSGVLRNRSGDFVYVIVYTINGQSYVMENVIIDE